ncbi:MAG: hypothetical protein QF926_02245 [Alphaproteobacteria bacterium]|nr:hypothetical protein [Alphaproteobacteria bacterium]MDP6515431.1 hypothetical protein [Alphaproteobacteria bacterium]
MINAAEVILAGMGGESTAPLAGGRRLSWAELAVLADRCGNGLRRRGAGPAIG